MPNPEGTAVMSHSARFLLILVGAVATLMAAGPTLIALVKASVPLVIAGGIVLIAARLVFFHTRKW